MSVYICFNDESGSLQDKNKKFYVRASLIINAEDLKKIEKRIKKIKEKKRLYNLDVEIKWQDLWQIKQCFEDKLEPKKQKLKEIYQHLNSIGKDHHLLINYCEKSLSILSKIDCQIILTFTETNKYLSHKPEDIYKFHMQTHLQRLQMQYQVDKNAIVLIIYDSMNEDEKKIFKQIYNKIITNGDFIKDYSVVYGSLLFDDSCSNTLLQITDFIAGSFVNLLVAVSKGNEKNYKKSVKFYSKYIKPKIPKKHGDIWGIGLMEVPTDRSIRENYKSKIGNLRGRFIKKYLKSIY